MQRFSLGGGAMASARGAQAYNGDLGAEPPAGSRGRAHGRGQGGEASLKLKAFWLLNVPQSRKIYPVSISSGTIASARGRSACILRIGGTIAPSPITLLPMHPPLAG